MANMPSSEPEFAAFVAIDWGSQKHCWRLCQPGHLTVETGELLNTPEALADWAMALRQRFHGNPVAVALEQKRGPVIYMLARFSHLALYPVPPAMAAAYRLAFYPSGAKSDPGDAQLLLELLCWHRQRLRPLSSEDPSTRLLLHLAEDRRHLVDEKTRQCLRLTDCLKQYFPQTLTWFDADHPALWAMIDRFADLREAQRCHPGTLHRFFRENHCVGQKRIQERIDAIYAAVPATLDPMLIEACSRKARALISILRALQLSITAYEKRSAELVSDHPESGIFASLPGAGPATIPRLIVAFGSDRDRYRSAAELQSFAGIAPVKEASGQSEWIHFRRSCPTFLRQTFHEYAAISVRYSPWARAYYDFYKAKGKPYHVIIRALAFKWMRILFRMWQDKTLYDERRYNDSIRRRSALAGAAVTAVTAPRWIEAAGFAKLTAPSA